MEYVEYGMVQKNIIIFCMAVDWLHGTSVKKQNN